MNFKTETTCLVASSIFWKNVEDNRREYIASAIQDVKPDQVKKLIKESYVYRALVL
jgi:hypothetical protein